MELSRARSFTTARPGEEWADIARRTLADQDPGQAVEALQSWNLHLFLRQPRGRILGCDVIFTEPPLTDAG
ncbi:MAG: hypothetical protein EA417_14540 [Gammaproteobacteria bacterium]|nr:MAG: hypothetical protein EA417_14540 [Gammaproteobacteria bacterium]